MASYRLRSRSVGPMGSDAGEGSVSSRGTQINEQLTGIQAALEDFHGILVQIGDRLARLEVEREEGTRPATMLSGGAAARGRDRVRTGPGVVRSRSTSPAQRRGGAAPGGTRPEATCSFSGHKKEHPLVFLRDLDKYLSDYSVPARQQLGVAMRCLKGNASDWGESELDDGHLGDYDDFKTALLAEYWTPARQELARLELYRSVWTPGSGVSMAEWMISMTRRAQFLDPPLPEGQLAYCLAHHFPDHVRVAFLSPGVPRTVRALRGFLRQLEGVKEWRQGLQLAGGPAGSRSTGEPARRGTGVPISAVTVEAEADPAPASEKPPAEPDQAPKKSRKRKGKRNEDTGPDNEGAAEPEPSGNA